MITVEKLKFKITINESFHEINQFIRLFHELKELVNQNKDVPLQKLEEFLNKIEFDDPIIVLRRKRNNLIEDCYKYLSSSGYDFSVKGSIMYTEWGAYPKLADLPKITLKNMISLGFDTALNISPVEWKISNTNKIVKIIYSKINDFNGYLMKSRSNYSIYVITGLIASHLGLIDSFDIYRKTHKNKKDKGYNKFLFDTIRNILNAKE